MYVFPLALVLSVVHNKIESEPAGLVDLVLDLHIHMRVGEVP